LIKNLHVPPLASLGPRSRPPLFRAVLALSLLGSSLLLSACGGGGSSGNEPNSALAEPSLSRAALGEKIFNDMSLSASGRQACASCHAAATGHASPNSLPAQLGGPSLDQQGARNSPSIRYLASNSAFHFDAEGTPTGGFFWDGRASSLQDQAGKPFFNPKEMANESVEALVARLARSSYAAEFAAMFGADIFSRPQDALKRMTLVLQAYEQGPEFQPFDSKYDEFLRGKVALSEQELRGLALFNAKDKGNCAACHPSAKSADGSHPLFTDFTYDNLGVPRNPKLSQNADPAFFDLGLCAKEGGELAARRELCGAFKVPSLRNVTQRLVYFHNGRFDSLREVLQFYVQRDTEPQKWYPLTPDGRVNKFDDLPAELHNNVNRSEGPYTRKPGEAPALSEQEIDDVLAFLATLSDGFKK